MARAHARRRGKALAQRRYNERTLALPDFRGMADLGFGDDEMGSIWGKLKKAGKGIGKGLKKAGKVGLKVARYTTPVGLAVTAIQKRKALGRALKKGAKFGLKVARYTTPLGLSVTAAQALIKNRKKIGRGFLKVGKLAGKGALYGTPIGLNILAAKKLAKVAKRAFGPKKPSKIRQPDGTTVDVEKTADALGVPEDAVRDAAIAANKVGDDPQARANAVDEVEKAYGLRPDALDTISDDVHDPEGPNFHSTDPGDNESGDDEGLRQDVAEDDVEESLSDEDLEGGHIDRESSSDRELEADEPDEPDDGGGGDEGDAGEGDDQVDGMGGPFAWRGGAIKVGGRRLPRGRLRPVRLAMRLGGRRMQFHGMGGPFSFVKNIGKGIGKGAKAVGKGVAKGGKAVGKAAAKAAKPIGKLGLQIGKTALERYTGIRLGGGGGDQSQALAVADEGGGINLKSPIVLAGGAAVVLGGIYLMTRKKT